MSRREFGVWALFSFVGLSSLFPVIQFFVDRPQPVFSNISFLSELGGPEGEKLLEDFAYLADGKARKRILSDPRCASDHNLVAPNFCFRPIDTLIQRGVDAYKNQGNAVVYDQPPFYQDLSMYDGLIFKLIQSGKIAEVDIFNSESIIELAGSLAQQLPLPLRQVFLWSRYHVPHRKRILFALPPISGIQERVAERMDRDTTKLFPLDLLSTQAYIPMSHNWTGAVNTEELEKISEEELVKHMHAIIDLYASQKSSSFPISASRVFTYFLEVNKGRISRALWDTTIILRLFCRHDLETGELIAPKTVRAVSTRAAELFLDEYSLSGNAQDLLRLDPKIVASHPAPQEVDVGTRVGAYYHVWNDAANVSVFPAEVVGLGTLYQQLSTLNQQGYAKLAADAFAASRAKRIEGMLNSLKNNG